MFLLHTVITSNEVLVVATRVNSLHVAWWAGDATVVMRYSVSCSALKANLKVEQSVEQFTDSAINSLNVDTLVPQTAYNCCIAEYGIDNSYSAVCKTATTLSAAVASDCQQGNSNNYYVALAYQTHASMTFLCVHLVHGAIIITSKF